MKETTANALCSHQSKADHTYNTNIHTHYIHIHNHTQKLHVSAVDDSNIRVIDSPDKSDYSPKSRKIVLNE